MKHQGTTERAAAAASTRLKTILMLVTCGAVAVTGDCNSTKTEMSNQPVNLHLNTQADIVSLCYNADHPDTVATINLGLNHPLAFTTSRMNEIGCVNIYYNTKLNRTFVLGSSVQTKEYQQVKKFPRLFIVSNNTMEWITCDGTMSTRPPDDICPKPLQNEMTNDQNPKPQPGKVDFVELAMGSAIGVLLLLNFGTCAGLIHYRKMALVVAESNSKRRSGRVVYSNAPQSREEEKEQEEEKHTASTKSPELDIYEEWDNSWHQHNPPSRHESENSLYQAGPWLTPTSDTHVIED